MLDKSYNTNYIDICAIYLGAKFICLIRKKSIDETNLETGREQLIAWSYICLSWS